VCVLFRLPAQGATSTLFAVSAASASGCHSATARRPACSAARTPVCGSANFAHAAPWLPQAAPAAARRWLFYASLPVATAACLTQFHASLRPCHPLLSDDAATLSPVELKPPFTLFH